MRHLTPALLILTGLCAAAYFAIEMEAIEFAIACLVVAIGVHEWNATSLSEQDAKRFQRE